jgi:hypothetical protein
MQPGECRVRLVRSHSSGRIHACAPLGADVSADLASGADKRCRLPDSYKLPG